VRGRDIKKWFYQTPYSIIVPYEEKLKYPLTMDDFKEHYPLTYNYFYESEYADVFIELLLNRGTYKKHHTKETPAHALYNIGYYTASPFKVIWKALQSKGMNACVISTQNEK